MSAHDGGAAFPCEEVVTVTQMQVGNDSPFPIAPHQKTIRHPGMTLRDWFAGQIASGDASCEVGWNSPTAEMLATRVALYYRISDAMIKHRALLAEDAAHKDK